MSIISSCPGAELSGAWLAPDFCAFELPISIRQPRGIWSTGPSSLLAVERGTSSVVQLFEQSTNNGSDDVQYTKSTVATAQGLNHGLTLHGGFLYASSSNVVYRWPYTSGENGRVVVENPNDTPETVIVNMNFEGPTSGSTRFGHSTRTLIFDNQNRLYVSVGSIGNVDPNSYRARIRRFALDDTPFPIDFSLGEVFADGLRNEVGLAFDKFGVLWGVENGADKLQRADLGVDIYNDNPAEDLHRFVEADAGKHWGYPWCWSEFKLEPDVGGGPGTQWAWPSFLANGVVDDDTCRTDYLGAELSMQAHSAPLGITFYEWKEPAERPPECSGISAFPKEMDGYAMIAFHGSWNRDVPTGYKVVYVEMDENGRAVGTTQDLLAHVPPNARWDDGFRPVDVDFDACGRLIVSSDGTGNPRRGDKMARIEYTAPQRTTDAPSPLPTGFTPGPTSALTGFPTTSPKTELPSQLPTGFNPGPTSSLASSPTMQQTTERDDSQPVSGSSGHSRFWRSRAAFLVGSMMILWTCSSAIH